MDYCDFFGGDRCPKIQPLKSLFLPVSCSHVQLLVNDKSLPIRARAIDALAKIGTEQAFEALVNLLRDTESSSHVRGLAASALVDIKSAYVL